MSDYLSTRDFPGDLKYMNSDDYKLLAQELRERLVQVVAKTGGHLASNLGVVELTMALYSVTDPYRDRIVWDVGHQTYVHKILTGRNDRLETIRSFNGLSGFPKASESLADCFNTGHSSTSISAALGMCRARDLRGEHYQVVAVVGDGALTGGMALEALNDAGRSATNLTVILNDNGMSISKNVGGLSRYLGRIRSRKSYLKAKKDVKRFLVRIPGIGKTLERLVHKVKASIKALFVEGEMFEDLGFQYFGPVDGHNVEAMKTLFARALNTPEPVLVHVVTQKGHGYDPAEANPQSFHGTTPFDPESGERQKDGCLSFSDNFGSQLCKMAEKDAEIVAVTAAMPSGTGLLPFEKQFPDRFFDVGIAEQHAVTMGAGMSRGGLKPVIAIYSTFLQRSYDQLLHDCAIQNVPIVLAVDRAGVCGPDGETHQGIYDMTFLNHLPNVTVAAPCCIEEQRMMLAMAVHIFEKDHAMLKGPFAVRYPAKDKYSFSREFIEKNPVVYGKGLMMNFVPFVTYDITILALGKMVDTAMRAASELKKEGLRALVFNARFLAPMDEEGILEACRLGGCVLTIEDGVKCGGLGSCVADLLLAHEMYLPLVIEGLPDETIPHGSIEEIHGLYGMNVDSICRDARKLIERKQGRQ